MMKVPTSSTFSSRSLPSVIYPMIYDWLTCREQDTSTSAANRVHYYWSNHSHHVNITINDSDNEHDMPMLPMIHRHNRVHSITIICTRSGRYPSVVMTALSDMYDPS